MNRGKQDRSPGGEAGTPDWEQPRASLPAPAPRVLKRQESK